MKNIKFVHVHDPMCGWCWGFRPALQQLLALLPTHIKVINVLGGLAADSDLPMPQDMQQYLQQAWRRIQERVPGTTFNFDFWVNCVPRRSTYPACRAVIAARQQGLEYDHKMTHAIQKAYYLEAKNPSDDSTLIALAESIGLNFEQFEKALNSTATRQVLADEIDFRTRLGVHEYPSLVLMVDHAEQHIGVDYSDANAMLQAIKTQVAALEGV